MVLTAHGLGRPKGRLAADPQFLHAGDDSAARLCRPAGEEHAEAMTASDHPAWSSPRQDSMKTQSKPFFVLPEAGKTFTFPEGILLPSCSVVNRPAKQ